MKIELIDHFMHNLMLFIVKNFQTFIFILYDFVRGLLQYFKIRNILVNIQPFRIVFHKTQFSIRDFYVLGVGSCLLSVTLPCH